jgi:AcrR family transcriptional regulator
MPAAAKTVPAKPPATKPDMKERILQTADRLFYLKGIRAIGVDTIAAEIGISKRTLYNHFPSKDALIAADLGIPYLTLRGRRGGSALAAAAASRLRSAASARAAAAVSR